MATRATEAKKEPGERLGETPEIVEVKKIWDYAPHNAFTDLARLDGGWLCTFREGEGHDSGDGRIRVLVSREGEQWESAALLEEEGVDLRDPKLSVMPDGRIMMVTCGCLYEGSMFRTRCPRVAFSKDGRDWSPPTRILAEDHWLWRVTWHDGKAYGVSKMGEHGEPRRAFLYASTDGLNYEWATRLEVTGVSETTLRFMPDGEMIALVRREFGSFHGWIGSCRPPYDKEWKWYEAKYPAQGPNFLILPDESMWACCRVWRPNQPPTTILARMGRDYYEPVLTLPSGGDTSYAGMVWHDDLFWISYYSSHEGKANIYLAKVRFEP